MNFKDDNLIQSLSNIYLQMLKENLRLDEAGGEAAGALELAKISFAQAKEYALKTFTKYNRELYTEVPGFDKNFGMAQKKARMGSTQRRDMPVIDTADVRQFQTRLAQGHIDLKAPFSDKTDPANPFPEGLSGGMAKDWLEHGLQDGDKKDDKIKVTMKKVKVGSLVPIQKQIYFDKSIEATAEFGADGTRKFLEGKSFFIASSDLRIIDGHHRFLSGVLLDPNIMVQTLIIDLPIAMLLPLSLSYGDAIGNVRNA